MEFKKKILILIIAAGCTCLPAHAMWNDIRESVKKVVIKYPVTAIIACGVVYVSAVCGITYGLIAYFRNVNEELLKAVWDNNLEGVKQSIAAGANVNMGILNFDGTILHKAARDCSFEVVKYLVEHKASLHAKNKSGATPLHDALHSENINKIEYLIEQGSNVDVQDNEGDTPLHKAARDCSFEVMKYLVEHNNALLHIKDSCGAVPLYDAVRSESIGKIEYLIEKGSIINARDNEGYAPLHVAAAMGLLKIVKFLIEKCAVDSTLQSIHHETAYDIAVQEGHRQTATYLQYVQNYFERDIQVPPTKKNKHLVPDYCALAIIKRDMPDARKSMFDNYIKLARRMKSPDIARELTALYFSLSQERPKNKDEHEAVMQLIKLQPGNTISRSFNDIKFSFK